MTHDFTRRSSDTSARTHLRSRYAARSMPAHWIILLSLAVAVLVVHAPIGSATAAGTGSEAAPLPHEAATQGHAPYPLVEVSDTGWIRLPLSTFSDYTARFYTYMHEGQPIEFFVLQSTDGVVRAAFNACDVCYRSLKGYDQDGQFMVCNNCGSRFPADQINIARGGCNPSPLERSVQDEVLFIHVDAIIAGAIYY